MTTAPVCVRRIVPVRSLWLWVLGLVTAGYLFGNLPWVQANLSKIIWALILVPGLIALFGAWKAGRAGHAAV